MYQFGIRIASMISSNICYKFYDSKGGLTLWRWSPVQQTFFHKWFLQAACQFEHGLQLTFLQGRLQNLEARVRNANGGPRQASDGAAGGAVTGDGTSILARMGVRRRTTSDAVTVSIFTSIGWTKSLATATVSSRGRNWQWTTGFSLPVDMGRVWIQRLTARAIFSLK